MLNIWCYKRGFIEKMKEKFGFRRLSKNKNEKWKYPKVKNRTN